MAERDAKRPGRVTAKATKRAAADTAAPGPVEIMESAQDLILRETVEAITQSLAALASKRNYDRQQTIETLGAISATAETAVALLG